MNTTAQATASETETIAAFESWWKQNHNASHLTLAPKGNYRYAFYRAEVAWQVWRQAALQVRERQAPDAETLRQAFEAWWENHQVYNTVIHSCERWGDGNREYTNSDTQEAWEVWEASCSHAARTAEACPVG